VLLAARPKRRRELVGIVDWRVSELARMGVELRFNTYAGADDVLALEPEVVGGGVTLCGRVLVFDDNGAHPGIQAAEVLAEAGANVDLVTSERMVALEIGGLNHAAYARIFHRRACG